ncbi:class I SAM-dependent methyltransferase [Actinomadura barringtoniae]|uniref:Class I SAM-dependent methyltransferase n=1 Tax=Actinomadura barringtoniae TaxID=1427535 RepID=A0A939PD74_9ACTN|nr:class I SAM-dependent methyltransferase [Actinomadura barringtoniae]MBO2450455.1 class I SAM-dependent methyltransferase [Actinomadura barringtoniae]
MPMNRFHQRFCRSSGWSRHVENSLLPWVLDGVDLGAHVLEVGPGYGVTTRLLQDRVPELTALEIDPALAARLREHTAASTATSASASGSVEVVEGDGTAMPFADEAFSGAVCFTMLHHVQSEPLQDKLFAEVDRVLRPGGVFAGSDSRVSAMFRLIHLYDTMVVVDPDTLTTRLEKAGFEDVEVSTSERALRFKARKPST